MTITDLEKLPLASIKSAGVYLIRCSNGSLYVGQAKHLSLRLKGHIALLRRGASRNPPMQAAWNKYGKHAFSFEVLETVPNPTRELLCEIENKWLVFYRGQGSNMFNVCPAAESRLGSKLSDESRERVRKSAIGRRHSAETRRQMSLARKGNQVMRGRQLSDEWKRNIGRNSHFRHLTPKEQIKKGMAMRKRYGFLSPDGRIVVVFGLNDWCQHNSLHLGAMSGVHAGKLNHHKGWRKIA